MRNLLQFILKYYAVLLFLVLETVALSILFQNSGFHQSWFINLSQGISGSYYEKVGNIREYLSLRQQNIELADENARLRNLLEKAYKSEEMYFYAVHDTMHGQRYYYTPAHIINNSVNKRQNYITLDKGEKDGIRPEMGVISTRGVVGIVLTVSKNFSTVISLLNTDFRLSAKLKKNDYYGSLFWPGNDYRQLILSEIPHHVSVNIGDTVVTSGFSSIFPEGILIGTVSDYSLSGGSFLELRVTLSNDFKNLNHVDVISNLRRVEQINLENTSSQ